MLQPQLLTVKSESDQHQHYAGTTTRQGTEQQPQAQQIHKCWITITSDYNCDLYLVTLDSKKSQPPSPPQTQILAFQKTWLGSHPTMLTTLPMESSQSLET